MHNKSYIINDDDFEVTALIESRIKNNYVNASNLKKPVKCLISDLKEFLTEETKSISFKLKCLVSLLGKDIDLGEGTVDISSLCIVNKDELLKLIEEHDDNDEVDLILIISDNDYDEITIKFDKVVL